MTGIEWRLCVDTQIPAFAGRSDLVWCATGSKHPVCASEFDGCKLKKHAKLAAICQAFLLRLLAGTNGHFSNLGRRIDPTNVSVAASIHHI